MKNKNTPSGSWSFSFDPSTDTPGEEKFELYLKARQISQANEILRDVVKLDRTSRKKWFLENADFVSQMMETFMDSSFQVIDGLQMDNEAMELSSQFVTSLREITSILQSLRHDVDGPVVF
ncbi:MAG: hypothetical protein ACOZAN_02640 [Patescibacteria group bacterium]